METSMPTLLQINTSLNGQGSATLTFNIPSDPTLLRRSFYNQWVLFDAPANSLGLTTSEAGHGVVGR